MYARLTQLADTEPQGAASGSGQNRSRHGRARYTRYHGLPANANPRPPPARYTPFKSLVSKVWAKRTRQTTMPVFPDPDDHTILKLDIPDEDLDSVDVEYYAEDEDVDSGGEGAGAEGSVSSSGNAGRDGSSSI